MLFAPRRRASVDLDLGPMVDVIFQLLIFFVLTSVAATSAIPLSLPQASTAIPVDTPPLEVVVDESGRCSLDGATITIEVLEVQLASRLASAPDLTLTVRAHKNARHESVVSVLDAARRAGLKKLRIACDKAPEHAK